MIVTRAAFLRLFGMAAVGIGVQPELIASTFGVEGACAEHFRPLLNDPFHLAGPTASASLVLGAVRERPLTKNVAQFSLIFHAPANAALPDAIYTMRHPAIGSMPTFVSGIGLPTGDRRLYQACFSRFVRT